MAPRWVPKLSESSSAPHNSYRRTMPSTGWEQGRDSRGWKSTASWESSKNAGSWGQWDSWNEAHGNDQRHWKQDDWGSGDCAGDGDIPPPPPPTDKVPIQREVAIPRQLIGMFLGKGGVAIKSICALTNCKAHVDTSTRQEELLDDEGQPIRVTQGYQGRHIVDENARVVIDGIEGTFGLDIEKAVQMVEERIAELQKNTHDSAQAARHVDIPGHLVGLFVGKGGKAIKDICARAGCSAYVEDLASGEAVIVVGRATETQESIDLGVALVQQRLSDVQNMIEHKEIPRPRHVAIPSRLVGQFVGKGGAAIKEICAIAGCRAHVDDEGNQDGEATVVVGNSADSSENIEKAVQLIEQRIAELLEASQNNLPQNEFTVARNGVRGDVQMEIRSALRMAEENNSPITMTDFDFKVVRFLKSIYEDRGRDSVHNALTKLVQVTTGKGREGVRSWPAYMLTLLRKYDFTTRSNSTRETEETEEDVLPPLEFFLPPLEDTVADGAPAPVARIPTPPVERSSEGCTSADYQEMAEELPCTADIPMPNIPMPSFLRGRQGGQPGIVVS